MQNKEQRYKLFGSLINLATTGIESVIDELIVLINSVITMGDNIINDATKYLSNLIEGTINPIGNLIDELIENGLSTAECLTNKIEFVLKIPYELIRNTTECVSLIIDSGVKLIADIITVAEIIFEFLNDIIEIANSCNIFDLNCLLQIGVQIIKVLSEAYKILSGAIEFVGTLSKTILTCKAVEVPSIIDGAITIGKEIINCLENLLSI